VFAANSARPIFVAYQQTVIFMIMCKWLNELIPKLDIPPSRQGTWVNLKINIFTLERYKIMCKWLNGLIPKIDFPTSRHGACISLPSQGTWVNLKLNIFTQTRYSTQQARYLGEFENQYFYFRAIHECIATPVPRQKNHVTPQWHIAGQ